MLHFLFWSQAVSVAFPTESLKGSFLAACGCRASTLSRSPNRLTSTNKISVFCVRCLHVSVRIILLLGALTLAIP